MVVGEFVTHKQVIVIGGGPGGYNAAIRAAQLGLEVMLIEKNKMGGVCLNEGCIPSKLFAHAAAQLRKLSHLDELGVKLNGDYTFDMQALKTKKDSVVSRLTNGVESLLKKHDIEVVHGTASFISSERIGVERGEAFDLYESDHIIIATGSSYAYPQGMEPNHSRVLDAASIYQLEEIPNHLLVYGSDYRALEAAAAFASFGSKVTIVLEGKEFPFDSAINRELGRQMKKAKMKYVKGAEVEKVTVTSEGVTLALHIRGEKREISGSHLYVTGESAPCVEDLHISAAGIQQQENGLIATNNRMETSVTGIYAVGDLASYVPLASTAIRQGKVAAENCAGNNSAIESSIVPHVIHFLQPVAFAGLTEEEAKAHDYQIQTGQFQLSGNGFAEITGEKSGFVKTVSEQETKKLLGFHAVGEGAIELITQGVLALELVAREEDLTSIYYPHPSFNEAWMEAIEDIEGLAIHKV